MTRLNLFHLMNEKQRRAAANPQTKPNDFGCDSTCKPLSSTPTIAIYYHSAWKVIHIVQAHRG